MALYRPPEYCPRCGKQLESRFLNQDDVPMMQRLIGDTFLGYEECSCPSLQEPVKGTLGILITESMIRNRVKTIPDISASILEQIKTDFVYPNSIPVYTFRNMLRLLAIDITQAEAAMYITFNELEKKKIKIKVYGYNDLWENTDALGKYIQRLKELMNEDITQESPAELIKYVDDSFKESAAIYGKVKKIPQYGGSIFVIFENDKSYRLSWQSYDMNSVTLDDTLNNSSL